MIATPILAAMALAGFVLVVVCALMARARGRAKKATAAYAADHAAALAEAYQGLHVHLEPYRVESLAENFCETSVGGRAS